jgi:hypothetical protein
MDNRYFHMSVWITKSASKKHQAGHPQLGDHVPDLLCARQRQRARRQDDQLQLTAADHRHQRRHPHRLEHQTLLPGNRQDAPLHRPPAVPRPYSSDAPILRENGSKESSPSTPSASVGSPTPAATAPLPSAPSRVRGGGGRGRPTRREELRGGGDRLISAGPAGRLAETTGGVAAHFGRG